MENTQKTWTKKKQRNQGHTSKTQRRKNTETMDKEKTRKPWTKRRKSPSSVCASPWCFINSKKHDL